MSDGEYTQVGPIEDAGSMDVDDTDNAGAGALLYLLPHLN